MRDLVEKPPKEEALSDLASGSDAVRKALVDVSRSCQSMQDLIARYDVEQTRLDAFYTDRIGTQMERMTSIQQALRAIARLPCPGPPAKTNTALRAPGVVARATP